MHLFVHFNVNISVNGTLSELHTSGYWAAGLKNSIFWHVKGTTANNEIPFSLCYNTLQLEERYKFIVEMLNFDYSNVIS